MLIRQEIRVWLIHGFYVTFFLFLTHRIFFPSFGMTQRCMSYVVYPFLKIYTVINSSLHQQAQDRADHKQVQDHLEALRIENHVLKNRLIQLECERCFLGQVQELMDYAQRYDVEQKTLGKVLMRSCNTQEDMMFIEGGANKNFSKDDIVVYKNALIGRVIEVYPWYSKVILVTDQRCRIAAELTNGINGICCGCNNQALKLSFIAHFKPVMVGDLIMSTGQGLLYPSGFGLGVVQSVTTDSVAHEITVKPMFDIDAIDYVYVLQKN